MRTIIPTILVISALTGCYKSAPSHDIDQQIIDSFIMPVREMIKVDDIANAYHKQYGYWPCDVNDLRAYCQSYCSKCPDVNYVILKDLTFAVDANDRFVMNFSNKKVPISISASKTLPDPNVLRLFKSIGNSSN